jgi:hypothetical protein
VRWTHFGKNNVGKCPGLGSEGFLEMCISCNQVLKLRYSVRADLITFCKFHTLRMPPWGWLAISKRMYNLSKRNYDIGKGDCATKVGAFEELMGSPERLVVI